MGDILEICPYNVGIEDEVSRVGWQFELGDGSCRNVQRTDTRRGVMSQPQGHGQGEAHVAAAHIQRLGGKGVFSRSGSSNLHQQGRA